MALVTLSGGKFQSSSGEILDSGYLTMTLSHDEQDPSTATQIAAGIPVRIQLDNSGNVSVGQQVWSTDPLLPIGAYYIIEAFRQDGTTAWESPQFETVPDTGTFNVSTWIPNQPVPQPTAPRITLQTNGVNNSNQVLENLVAGTNITLSNSGGATTITASGGITAATLPSLGTSFLYCDGSTGNPFGVAIEGIQTVSTATTAHIAGNVASEGTCSTYTGSAGSSPNTDCSWRAGLDSTVNTVVRSTLLSSRRYTFRQAMAGPTAFRYWVGITTSATALNGNLFATDTPNAGYIGFRFSTTTDTTWKAVTGTSNVAQTVVNTGVVFTAAPSTVFQLFPNSTATSVDFYINGTNVATINTNLIGGNSPVAIFGTGDNKSTGSSTPSITFCYAVIEYK